MTNLFIVVSIGEPSENIEMYFQWKSIIEETLIYKGQTTDVLGMLPQSEISLVLANS